MVNLCRCEKSVDRIFHTPPFGKKVDHPSVKVSLFLGHSFSWEQDSQPALKFSMKKVVLPIYRMVPRIPGFPESLDAFRCTPVSRRLGSVALAYEHNIRRMRTRYRLADINYVLFHVRFEVGLSISVLRNSVTPLGVQYR